MPDDKVECKNPDPEKQSTNIDKWKYNAVKRAILDALPAGDDQGVEFRRLPDLVEERLSSDELVNLGSVGWYTTTVKLDLEARGEIERIPGSSPQRLRRTP